MSQYNHEQHRGQEKEKPPKEGNTRNPQRHGMRHRQITKTVIGCILSKRENVKAKVRAIPGSFAWTRPGRRRITRTTRKYIVSDARIQCSPHCISSNQMFDCPQPSESRRQAPVPTPTGGEGNRGMPYTAVPRSGAFYNSSQK